MNARHSIRAQRKTLNEARNLSGQRKRGELTEGNRRSLSQASVVVGAAFSQYGRYIGRQRTLVEEAAPPENLELSRVRAELFFPRVSNLKCFAFSRRSI